METTDSNPTEVQSEGWLDRLRARRNFVLFVIGLVGFIGPLVLAPEAARELVIPPAVYSDNDPSLPLGRIGPRVGGETLFVKPFLFQLASTEKMTGLEREQILQAQYQDILKGLHGEVPKVEVGQINGLTAVSIDGQAVATVLPADAPEYYSRLSDERKRKLELMIAQRWKRLLEVDLALESFRRSPEVLAEFPYIAAALFFLSVALHALADTLARRYLNSPGWSFKSLIWLTFLSVCAMLHPGLKPLAVPLVNGGLKPVVLSLLIWCFCHAGYLLGCRLLTNYAKAYVQRHHSAGRDIQQRIDTIIHGGRFLIGTVLTVFGVATFVSGMGVNLGNIFAGAGVAGIALGVVGKDILIDYFYGINILADDQFNLGDFIETPVATGIVESFNLRTTRIREIDGGLSIVTNGRMTVIKNHSREFANTDFRVSVAYGSDVERSMKVICEEITAMHEENCGVIDPTPIFVGVQTLAESTVILQARVKTAPLAQWAVSRELNKRVLLRFHKEGIDIPCPRQQIVLTQDGDSKQPD